MANITPVSTLDSESGQAVVKWGPMANGDVGLPANLGNYWVRSVQLTGTLGASGAMTFQGANDILSPTWATLNDAGGTALVVTALGIKSIRELPFQVRPSITAGDGTTALNVIMFAVKTKD